MIRGCCFQRGLVRVLEQRWVVPEKFRKALLHQRAAPTKEPNNNFFFSFTKGWKNRQRKEVFFLFWESLTPLGKEERPAAPYLRRFQHASEERVTPKEKVAAAALRGIQVRGARLFSGMWEDAAAPLRGGFPEQPHHWKTREEPAAHIQICSKHSSWSFACPSSNQTHTSGLFW